MKIAGRLELLHAGRVRAVSREFDIEGDALEFTLEVPLSPQLLDNLGGRFGPTIPGHTSPPDAVLRVSWGRDLSDEAELRVPGRNQAIAYAQVRYGRPPGQPELAPVRSSLDGNRWQQRMTFQPLPESGELTFRLSSRLLDIRSAVGVVPVANLRSRIV